ncbi:polynucleotide kinase 3 phosphatase-domain-containing protein [Phycomyces nitens]|nr:polynucleotide kinase 3 phosphatase-domain-containing protein [Phycomyces nitens]
MKRSSSKVLESAAKHKEPQRIHPFFAEKPKEPMKRPIRWISSVDSVLFGKSLGNEQGRSKIAAFDLDSTLITTKSGRVHAKDENDWQWWHSSVQSKIENLHQEGYKIVIFSNQNGLNTDTRINGFKSKAAAILSQLSIPVWIFAALHKDGYRKPCTGMWDLLEKEANDDVQIDRSNSLFIGDAAGRQDGWKPKVKKDHSCADRKFAANIGIEFKTPEEFFLNEPKAPFTWGPFDPHIIDKDATLSIPKLGSEPHVVVFVGYPASGKSKFANKYLVPKGYIHVNQDTLKTRKKCIEAVKKALDERKSVVIDNTNPEASTRALYIRLAKDSGVPIHCFYFTADEHLSRHNNYYRALNPPHDREVLSDIVFRTFKAKLQEPNESEGFDTIHKIPFVFEGSDLEGWQKWWI